MAYNFDEQINRIGTGSHKWDQYNDPDIIAMGTADMDFKSADCIVDALVATAQRGMYGYFNKPDSYYESIIGWYRRKYHWPVRREWLLNTPGLWGALRLCLSSYCKPGDRVIVQTPHFSPIVPIVAQAGCHLVTNPMVLENGRYRVDFDDFETKVAKTRPSVYFMVNPHNPTSHVFSREEILELTRICKQYQVVMVSDEVHSYVMFDGHTHCPAASVSDDALMNTVILNATSKGYNLMDLTYCIVVIANPELRRKYEETLSGYCYDFATNVFSIVSVEAAFSEAADPWMRDLNVYLQGNLDYMVEYFKRYIPKIEVIRPEGSYLVWLDCRKLNMTPAEIKTFFLTKAKVGLTFGDTFGTYGEGFARMNIGCPRKTLEEALGRIRAATDSL